MLTGVKPEQKSKEEPLTIPVETSSEINVLPFYKIIYKSVITTSNKKIISFSVYGSKSVYSLGAIKNIEVAKEVYPDWICRFYCTSEIANLDELKTLASEGKCELFILESDIFPMYWRYFASDDTDISHVIFRDTDSLVNFREEAAVSDWLSSNATLHSMHDNDVGHWSPIMGGMCGLKLPIDLNMTKSIDDWTKSRNYKFHYSDDQSFLSKIVLNKYNNSVLDHHNNPASSKFKNSVPFPNHKPSKYADFVGARTSSFHLSKSNPSLDNSKYAFVIPHLGPGDYFVVRDCIQALINKYESVVLPVKTQNQFILRYMFGGYNNVLIELVEDDDQCFSIYNQKYLKTHKMIGLGVNGPNVEGGSWGAKPAFIQSGLPYQQNIFQPKICPKTNFSNFNHNLKQQIDGHLPKSNESLKESVAQAYLGTKEPVKVDEKPLVSAIVATYNRFDFLLNTINSIKSQTYDNLEILVINDKSTDERYYSFNWEAFGVNIIHLDPSSKETVGFPVPGGFQRNFGMKSAKGEFFAFCDDDDIWLPNKISEQISAMNSTNCKMSCTDGYRGSGVYNPENSYKLYNKEIFFENLKNKYKNTPYDFSKYENNFPPIWNEEFFKTHNCAICSSVVIHKSIFHAVGDFTPMKAADDYQYWKRVIKHTDCAYIDKPLIYYDAGHGGGINYSWS